jgi:hypothetical protein
MKRGSILAVVLLVGCGQSGDSKEKPAPGSDSAGAAVGTSRQVTAATDAAAPLDDAAFTALVEAVARKTARRVEGQGAAQLSEEERGLRYAILEPDDMNDGRGAYVVEESAGKLWLVSYYYDGRSMPGLAEGGRAIDHAQGHHHGGETVRFAFRAGAPVVLYHEYVDDVEEGEPEIKEYAKDGVCTSPCPPLRGYPTNDIDFQVIGPAATAEALIAKPE